MVKGFQLGVAAASGLEQDDIPGHERRGGLGQAGKRRIGQPLVETADLEAVTSGNHGDAPDPLHRHGEQPEAIEPAGRIAPAEPERNPNQRLRRGGKRAAGHAEAEG